MQTIKEIEKKIGEIYDCFHNIGIMDAAWFKTIQAQNKIIDMLKAEIKARDERENVFISKHKEMLERESLNLNSVGKYEYLYTTISFENEKLKSEIKERDDKLLMIGAEYEKFKREI